MEDEDRSKKEEEIKEKLKDGAKYTSQDMEYKRRIEYEELEDE